LTVYIFEYTIKNRPEYNSEITERMERMGSLVDSFSLREINFAKTRLNILKVVKDRITQKDFDDITVDEICKYAEISRGTFFNYFPSKNHIFNYYIRVWMIQLGLEMEKQKFKSSQEKIKKIYDKVIEEDTNYPGFIENYLKYLLESKEINNEIKLTQAELAYKFSLENIKKEDMEMFNSLSIEKIFENFINEGVSNGEFKKDINKENTLLLLLSLFFSPAVMKFINKSFDLKRYYEEALDNIFHNV